MLPDPRSNLLESPGQGRMQNFVAELLRHEGALVEAIEPDGLEVLAPPQVQRVLGVGELSRLGFGAGLPPAAQRVGVEGDWLDGLDRVLGRQGRVVRHFVLTAARSPGNPERVLGHELVLDNATFRLLGMSAAWTCYLLLDFRASAVSDDKRDFIVRLGVDLATGALPDAVLAAVTLAFEHPSRGEGPAELILPEDAELPALWDRPRMLALVGRALPLRREAVLGPFVTGMRRRFGRDRRGCTCITTICTATRCAAPWHCPTVIRSGSARNSGLRQLDASTERSSMTSNANMRRASLSNGSRAWKLLCSRTGPPCRFGGARPTGQFCSTGIRWRGGWSHRPAKQPLRRNGHAWCATTRCIWSFPPPWAPVRAVAGPSVARATLTAARSVARRKRDRTDYPACCDSEVVAVLAPAITGRSWPSQSERGGREIATMVFPRT